MLLYFHIASGFPQRFRAQLAQLACLRNVTVEQVRCAHGRSPATAHRATGSLAQRRL